MTTACRVYISYSNRTQLRNEFGGLPSATSSKIPKMNGLLKSELSSSCKSLDKNLAQVQHHMLDALASFMAVVEASEKQEDITLNDVLNAIKTACKLVGNASCKMSQLAVQDFNKSLLPMV